MLFRSRRGAVAELSVPRSGVWGAASGLLLTGAIVGGAAWRGDPLVSEFLLFGPPLIISGALCGSGSLALAKRAERSALPPLPEYRRIEPED